jgi:hypothetical protein
MAPTPWRYASVAVLLGVAVGAFSSRADFLPIDTPLIVLAAMGNATGPWVAAAFAAGAAACRPRAGAVGGAIALGIGVGTYYVAALLTWPAGPPSSLGLLVPAWLTVAVASGSVVGASGGLWASGGRYRMVGPIILGGALLAEATYRFILVEAWTGIDLSRTALQVALVDLVAALLVPVILLERNRWPVAYLGSAVVAAIGALLLAGAEGVIRYALSG